MKKKAIALIPFLARRKRRNQAERGAKIGGPALLGLGAAAGAFILRRRRRAAAGFDASPSELSGQGRPSTFEGDPAESFPAAGAAGVGKNSVVPDTSTDDPSVVEAENAAAAEAGAIGGDVPDTPPPGNAYESFSERES